MDGRKKKDLRVGVPGLFTSVLLFDENKQDHLCLRLTTHRTKGIPEMEQESLLGTSELTSIGVVFWI